MSTRQSDWRLHHDGCLLKLFHGLGGSVCSGKNIGVDHDQHLKFFNLMLQCRNFFLLPFQNVFHCNFDSFKLQDPVLEFENIVLFGFLCHASPRILLSATCREKQISKNHIVFCVFCQHKKKLCLQSFFKTIYLVLLNFVGNSYIRDNLILPCWQLWSHICGSIHRLCLQLHSSHSIHDRRLIVP